MIDVEMLRQIGAMAQGQPPGVAYPLSLVTRPAPDRPSAVPPYVSPTADVEDLLRQNVAASLAAGMIAAGGRPVTAEEAVQVWREVREALGKRGETPL